MNPGVTGVVLGAQTAARKKPYVSIDIKDKMWTFQNFGDFSSQTGNIMAIDYASIGSSALLGYVDVTGGVNVKVIGAAAATASANWNPTGFTGIATGAWNSGDAQVVLQVAGSSAYVYWATKANLTSAFSASYSITNDYGATWATQATAGMYGGTLAYETWYFADAVQSGYLDYFVRTSTASGYQTDGTKYDGTSYGTTILRTLPTELRLVSSTHSGISKPIFVSDDSLQKVQHLFFVSNKISSGIDGCNIIKSTYDYNAGDWYPTQRITSIDSPAVGSFIGNLNYMSGLRYSKVADSHILTYAQTNSLGTTFRYIKSEDLTHWTAPNVFSSDIWGMDNYSNAAGVPYSGGYLFGVGNTAFTWDSTRMSFATMYVSSHPQKNLSLSGDVLNYTIAKGNMGAKIIIEVANSGKYVGPSPSATGAAALKRDAEVYVQEGWVTNASGNQLVPEGLYYIDSIEQATTPTTDNIRITARDKFKHINNYVAETLIPYDNQQFAAGRLDDPQLWIKTSSQTFNTATYSMPMVAGDEFWWQQKLRDGGYGLKCSLVDATSNIMIHFQYANASNYYKLSVTNGSSLVYQIADNSSSLRVNGYSAAYTGLTNFEIQKDEVGLTLVIDNARVGIATSVTKDFEIGAFGVLCDSGSANVFDVYSYENYPQRSVGWMLDDIAYKGEMQYGLQNQQNSYIEYFNVSPLTGWTMYATANGAWASVSAEHRLTATGTVANSPYMILTNSDVMLSANANEPSNGRIDINYRVTMANSGTYSSGGMIACATDSANFLLAKISPSSAFIQKCIGGTYTTLAYAPIIMPALTYTPVSMIVQKDWATIEVNGNSILSTKLSAVSLTGQKIGFWSNGAWSTDVLRLSGDLRIPTLFQPVPPTMMFPGQDALTFMEQVASIQDARCFSRYDGSFAAKKCADSGTIQRTYYNEVQSGGDFANDQKYNHVVVVGATNASGLPSKAQSFNFTKIASAGNALRTYFTFDQNLTSNNACQEKADELIASFGNTYQYVPLHIWRDVGLEQFDTVSVIDTRSSYQTGTFNVYGLQKRYDAKMMQYDELLNLGNFTDQSTQGLGRGQSTPTQNIGFGTPISPTEIIATVDPITGTLGSNTGTTGGGSTGRTHTVVSGDTLWDLAIKYYGNPWEYNKIFEANRDKINDPHWIYPGQVLRIP